MAKMSAHDTIPGQVSSTVYLISSMTSNPRREFRLGPACFSLTMLPKLSSKSDASHPYQKQKIPLVTVNHVC